MSEQATGNSQQTLVIGLVVIAALLAAIVGVIIYQQSSANSLPQPTAQTTPAATDPSGAPAGMGGAPAGMGQSAPAAEFDAKTATKVAAGVEPEAWVTEYYEACEKDDWAAAFDRLPAAKKANNSPEALKEQVTGYGIEGYKVTSAKVEGDKATVIVDQVTGQYGTFENTWSFVKVDGEWLVENKAVTGMK